ncbi:MAG TPA: histidine--tRNA ligase, partial [Fimbriimonadaceae bacterium]|nr:histidine--tRNA ligase [Fimbriimonadaceae bacterium]
RARVEAAARSILEGAGYERIETPTFEATELFTRGVGQSTDIVTKEMYTFTDRGGRSVTLKPEGTAPAIRAVVEHSLLQQGTPLRLYYITSMFRYERPQHGRLRELHQVGLELIGSETPRADAEIIEATVAFYHAIGLSGVTVHLNSLGTTECRARYREQLLKFAEPYLKSQPDEVRARAERNPLRMLDFKDPEAIEALKGAPVMLDSLSDDARARFERVQALLSGAGIRFEVRPNIVRGLDYYAHTVFEIHSDKLGAQSQICGGGRYDGLVKELGGPPLGCVGVGVGVERTLIAQAAEGGCTDVRGIDVCVVCAGAAALDPADRLARELRADGLSVVTDVDERNLKNQFKHADRVSARFAAILGEDELAADTVTLRDMASSDQVSVPRGRILEELRSRF